ncbi:PP2C family protein-serine/threonine phosphatase [Variovorax guangxiensis]|uniref:Serine/threonine-protein phosphatase n=1 Tax=Variovorax guangxiensis TaxID=1775474 RepID=A0A502DR31_9BURK|nr:protein phosphatase 2C domain-containing protein [Variovorax guangxiensis]RZI69382.1 MAG: serine/threonine-protein phosphatase [Variovorax sp.]TPG22996.1 serine/threonine-protein phosphatase [Variovorax ginsengisoli]TPG27544.1 serine/threonine-protein phosphatase [Variovorax guangxiensis]
MTPGFRLTAATGLHKGDRPYQQDQVLVLSHPRALGCVLGVIADGMGGRSGGRKASDQVLMTARQLFARYRPEHDDASALLKQLLDEAHTVIKLTALSSEQEPHSTLAAFLVNPKGDCTWIHAGDSRLYHFHRGQLVQRTRDHSYVQVLIDRGELTEDQANVHPQGNILLGCLGMTSTPPPVETHFIAQLEPGDLLLACSDGLWHYFSAEEMGAVLATQTPRIAVEMLLAEARRRARGTGDNVSLVVLKVEPLPATEPATETAVTLV